MSLLQLSLVLSLFILPLLEHISLDLLLELFKLFLSVLAYQFLPVCVLISDRLLLVVNLFLFAFILFN